MLGKIRGNKFIKNTGWIIGEQIARMILSFFIGILTARYLGPDNLGELNYTASFVSFFTSVATLGMNSVILKRIINEPEKEGEILGSSLVYRLIASVLSTISILVLVSILNQDDPLKIVLVLLQSVQLFCNAANIFDVWFVKRLESKYSSIAKLLSYIAFSLYRIYLLVTGKSVVWFAFATSFDLFIALIIMILMYKKQGGSSLKFNIVTGYGILKDSYHFIISGIMVSIYSQMDRIMLGKMVSTSSVGLYSVAASLCSMWIFIPNAIITSAEPVILKLRENDYKKYIKRLEQLYSVIILICILASVAVWVLGDFAINLLYGEAYRGSVSVLNILIWSELFSMIGTARGIWIMAENKNKYVKYYLLIGSIVNVILNAILIPVFGITGAAVATLITQITTSIIAPLFFKSTRIHTKLVFEALFFLWKRVD